MLLPDHPINRFLPPVLLQPGPREVLWWQWIALPGVLAAAWLFGAGLGRVTTHLALRLARRTKPKWDDELVSQLGAPITLAWTCVAAQVLVALLLLAPVADLFVGRILHAGLFVAFFWALLRAVDVASAVTGESGWARTYPQSRSLVPLASRVAKVAVVAISVVAVLAEFGYPVASLIAGLGIGGLAVALAAQKTLENLFAAFAIGVDQPFREGDYVKFADVSGTVEAVGLRSTRIRTLDRTIVTIPNGRLAEMQVETFAARDRIKLAFTLGLEMGATSAQVRDVVRGVDALLRAHPKMFAEPSVRFVGIGASSLNVEIFSHLQTPDWNEFQKLREDLLLGVLSVVERAGTRLAFPTQTVEIRAQQAGAKAAGQP